MGPPVFPSGRVNLSAAAQRYRAAVTTTHILDLIDGRTLGYLLNGVANELQGEVRVVWRESSSWRSPRDAHLPVLAAPFCAQYRSDPQRDARCTACYQSHAAAFYSGARSETFIYRCHAGLWNAACPVTIDEQVLGVLFAGQMILPGPRSEWPQALRAAAQYVDKDDDVAEPIGTRHPLEVNADQAVRRLQGLVEFGGALEALARDLQRVRMTAAGQILLHRVDEYLAAEIGSRDGWWRTVADAGRCLREVAAIRLATVFERWGNRFIERARLGEPERTLEPHDVPATACYRAPVGEEASIAGFEGLADALHVASESWVLRTSSRPERGHHTSLLFVFDGRPDDMARSFCQAVMRTGQIADLIFHIANAQRIFETRARHVAHAAKTPLMAAMSLARQARRSPSGEQLGEYLQQIEEVILDARSEIGLLYEELSTSHVRIDLRDLLSDLTDQMRPLAEGKRCRLLLRLPEQPILVSVLVPDMRAALGNLLNNAIKYSYKDRTVTVGTASLADDRAEVFFQNEGPGISTELVNNLLRERRKSPPEALPTDYRRLSNGLGLPIAYEILDQHGGTLEIVSHEVRQSEVATAPRCVTTATVTLPVTED